jgi:hypothetical protein
MTRRRKYDLPIDRTWTATAKRADGTRITVTLHGPNPTAAERTYTAEHPETVTLVIHQENWR